jgi:hypothetical protein
MRRSGVRFSSRAPKPLRADARPELAIWEARAYCLGRGLEWNPAKPFANVPNVYQRADAAFAFQDREASTGHPAQPWPSRMHAQAMTSQSHGRTLTPQHRRRWFRRRRLPSTVSSVTHATRRKGREGWSATQPGPPQQDPGLSNLTYGVRVWFRVVSSRPAPSGRTAPSPARGRAGTGRRPRLCDTTRSQWRRAARRRSADKGRHRRT